MEKARDLVEGYVNECNTIPLHYGIAQITPIGKLEGHAGAIFALRLQNALRSQEALRTGFQRLCHAGKV